MLRLTTRNSTYLLATPDGPHDATIMCVQGRWEGESMFYMSVEIDSEQRLIAHDHDGRLCLQTTPIIAYTSVED